MCAHNTPFSHLYYFVILLLVLFPSCQGYLGYFHGNTFCKKTALQARNEPCCSNVLDMKENSVDILDGSLDRRQIIRTVSSFGILSAFAQNFNSVANAISIDEAREIGERRLEEIEKAKGEKKKTTTGIKYREMKVGNGPEVKDGDVCYITYQVTALNGDYMFSLGRGQELKKDIGEQYRMVLGKKQVPAAVEMGMEGMREGGVRNILVPPNLGWRTSNGLPEPDTFSGRRKLERQIDSAVLFEIQLDRVRASKQ